MTNMSSDMALQRALNVVLVSEMTKSRGEGEVVWALSYVAENQKHLHRHWKHTSTWR